jgi:hypothetical protein
MIALLPKNAFFLALTIRVNIANLALLSELRRRAPDAIDWDQLTAAGVVAQRDAFQSRTASSRTPALIGAAPDRPLLGIEY